MSSTKRHIKVCHIWCLLTQVIVVSLAVHLAVSDQPAPVDALAFQADHQQPHNHHNHNLNNARQPAANMNPCLVKSWSHRGDSCFKFFMSPRNLENVKSKCKELGGQLAYVDDEDKHENLVHMLSERKDGSSKQYYIQLSDELFGQYQNKLLESTESESTINEIWLPRDDLTMVNVSSFIKDLQNPDKLKNSFVYAFSQIHRRWGLIPFDPTRKMSYICERPVGSEQQQHGSADNAQTNTQGSENQRNEPPLSPSTLTSSSQTDNISTNEAKHKTDNETIKASSEPNSSVFREYPQDQWIVLGSTAEMRCSGLDPEFPLVWTLDGKNLTNKGRVEVYPNGTLKIKAVRNFDVGVYTCTINSGTGVIESRSARLGIIELPYPPAYVTSELLDKVSTSVRLKWTPGFNGNSPITRYTVEMKVVNGEKIESDSTSMNSWEVAKTNISADQTSVIIPDLKPARKYIFRVKASNRVGTGLPSNPTKDAIEVPIQPPSLPPENLTGTPRSATSISVQWSPPPQDSQNGIIKGYKIRHKLAGYSDSNELGWYISDVANGAQHTYTLDDLIIWQNYEIQIAAENDKGVGPYSASIFVRTKEGKPDKGPENVMAEAQSSKTIKVTWDPPLPQHINGINLGYRVQLYNDPQYKQVVKELVVQPNSVPSSSHSVLIDSLQAYTQYHILVVCYTIAGEGPPNENAVTVRTKEDLPEAVQSIEFADVLDKSLRLLWKPPNRINGELKHYTLEYSESSSIDNKLLKTFSPGITEAKIVDLEPRTSYTFKLNPHTNVGQGPGKVATITTSVPPVLPEPPTNLVCIEVGSNNATIQFNQGFDGNASIEKWIVEAQISSRGERWVQIYVSTNHSKGNSLVVRNLKPYTSYRIRLRPVNVAGQSELPSEPSPEFQTLQVEPEQPPRDFSIDDIRSNSLVARWTPLANNLWRGNPRGYNLTWSDYGNTTSMYIMINDTDAHEYLVSELEEFTEYVFKIYAINEAGPSPPSTPLIVTTAEDTPTAGPTNVTAQALSPSSISVNWLPVPKRHRNGVIKGYKIKYQCSRPNSPLLHKTIEDNNTRHTTLTDLKPFSTYHLAISAFTTVGEGVYSSLVNVLTMEDTPSSPTNLSFPSLSQTSARILWDPPEDANGDIIGYKVSYHPLTEGNKETSSFELPPNERSFRSTNLKGDTHYVFTVTAKTREGWGQQANLLVYTHDSELRANLPYFRESWFVILCACSSVVITITITALLFVQSKSYKYKQDAMKSTSHDRLGEAGFTIDDDPTNSYQNGYGLVSHDLNRQKRSGSIPSQNASTIPKAPPRPYPSSMAYSDEGEDDVFEEIVEQKPTRSVANSAYDDTSDDSLPEKPSELSSNTGPGSESAEEEYVNMVNKNYQANHYANVNGTFRKNKQGWKKNNKYYSNSSNTKAKMMPQRAAPVAPNAPSSSGEFNSSGSLTSDQPNTQNTFNPVQGSSGIALTNGGRDVMATQSEQSESQPNHSSNNHQVQQQLHQQHQQQQQEQIILQHRQQQQYQPQILAQQSAYAQSQAQNQMRARIANQTHDSANGSDAVDASHSQNNDPLNNPIINLNGGRIIVDNMAGSRAPLPGFTSFLM